MSVNPRAVEDLPTAAAASHEADFFQVKVVQKTAVADGIYQFDLRHADGAPLPAFTPGAHLTVELPNGLRRNYSLCSDPVDSSLYQIAVKRDAAGRGGSLSMADEVQVDQLLSISSPRNNFELSERAKSFIFVAGGIGITPILSMMRQLKRIGQRDFKLYYCSRDAGSSAFLELIQTEFSDQVQIHHDNGDIDQALDFWPIFEKPSAAHIYCCGPKGLMDSVEDMSGHWPSGAVHFESFGVDAQAFAEDKAFDVQLAKTGITVHVSAEQTLLQALRGAGLKLSSSCESGTCGTCKTGLISGAVEHRDMVLLDEEKSDQIMVCVSRAVSGELVLDL